jgi:hypothetical protein
MIVFFGIIILVYLIKKEQWEVLYESNSIDKSKLYEQLSYLRANNIRCKIDMLNSRGYSSGVGRSSFEVRNQETVQLKVHKSDYEKAKQLLP